MNNIIRHSKLSAREAWTKRDMSTGEELTVSDKELIKKKYDQRCSGHESSARYKARGKEPSPLPEVEVGQLAHIYSDRSKLRARDKYLVTAVEDKEVILQKFTKNQFRSKEYRVKKSDLILIPAEMSSIPPNLPRSEQSHHEDFYNRMETPPLVQPKNLPLVQHKDIHIDSTDSSDYDSDSSTDDQDLPSKLRLFLPNNKPQRQDDEDTGPIVNILPTVADVPVINIIPPVDAEVDDVVPRASQPVRTTRGRLPSHLKDFITDRDVKQRHQSV